MAPVELELQTLAFLAAAITLELLLQSVLGRRRRLDRQLVAQGAFALQLSLLHASLRGPLCFQLPLQLASLRRVQRRKPTFVGALVPLQLKALRIVQAL